MILLILDSSQKNERKMIFLHYILDWIDCGLSKFESRLNGFSINNFIDKFIQWIYIFLNGPFAFAC
ncbi:hypothetical protein BK025_02375 [Sodalis sp. TME1]|nr:hypothetical protein BK025_02375 [Sodalis sp. TME1]